jgi:hypothetical protein
MGMEIGYDPGRIHALVQHTRAALDALGRLTSNDPAAADAMRVVRLTRRNLEDHWMAALCDIERSDAMVTWWSSRLAPTRPTLARSPTGHPSDTVAARPRRPVDELMAELDRLERRSLLGDDAPGAPSIAEITALATQLAAWVARDHDVAEQLVELSVTNMLVGRLLSAARFPSWFSSAVVQRMAAPNGPDNGVDPDRYAASLSAALAGLADDPSACLDLLLDRPTVYALASWEVLDATALSDMVVSGLYEAVVDDPSRLGDGYQVLQFLTSAANGPLEDGMAAGMAVGVATALAGYVDTLAPAIRQEGDTPVSIRALDPPLELGTYDDLVDLFGALLRVPEAQAALGTVLAAYTFDCFERAGGRVTSLPDVSNMARFADLLADADRAERAELLTAAAAEESRRRRLGNLIGFGADTTLLAGGASSVVRAIAGRAVLAAVGWGERAEPVRRTDANLAAHAYDLVTVAAVSTMAADPAGREVAGLADVPDADWTEIERHLDAIRTADGPHDRMLAVGALDHFVETTVPSLARHLVEIRKLPGLDELTEARDAVGTD